MLKWLKKKTKQEKPSVEEAADEVVCSVQAKLDSIKGSEFFFHKEQDVETITMYKKDIGKWMKIDEDTNWFAQFIEVPEEFDLKCKEWNILFGYGVKGAKLEIHTHPQSERIWVLEGAMREVVSGKLYVPGPIACEIPGQIRHGWLMEEDTFYIIQFYPPLGVEFLEDEEEYRSPETKEIKKTMGLR